MTIEVVFPKLEKLINEEFIQSFHNRDRYLIEWGGRGSSKSVFAAKKLIKRCLEEKYFRYILYRTVFDTIRDSQWQTLKDCVNEMGLSDLFHFTTHPLEIVCLNGNKFLARGGDKTEKIKSLKDPSGVWYEEDIPNEDDFYNITGSIRTSKAEYLQEIFTLNPEVDGYFENNWFWKKFFLKHQGELHFTDKTVIKIDDKEIALNYTCHHTTYHHNRFIPDEYKALLEGYKFTNPYKYTVHTLGQWGNKDTSDRFWKDFDNTKHVDKRGIDLDLPLMISFDENVNPYPALGVWQEKDKEIRQIHEICLRSPRNKLIEVAKEFVKWCRAKNFDNIVFIFGDATSDKEDTKLAEGYNYFTLLQKEISQTYSCRIKKSSKNPPVALSAEFINSIYAYNYEGYSIVIDPSCKESINDYRMVQEASDGSMKKPKKDGIELMGHCSDQKRYFIIEYLNSVYEKYKRRNDKSKNYAFDRLPDRRF